MRIGLTLPSFVDDPEVPLQVARAAEDAGLDGVFAYDHLWRGAGEHRRPALECFALLGAVAAETRTIAIGSLVARATLRPPAVLASCFDTVQRVSGGRLIAAIGAGDSESRAENEAFGLPFGTLPARLAALHDAVRAARDRGYPVWVGGRSRHVLAQVADADGWNAWGIDPGEFAREAAAVRAVAPQTECTWGGLVLTGADDREIAAKAAVRRVGRHVVVGPPAHLADRLRAYADAGAAWAILGALDSSDPANASRLGEVRLALAPS